MSLGTSNIHAKQHDAKCLTKRLQCFAVSQFPSAHTASTMSSPCPEDAAPVPPSQTRAPLCLTEEPQFLCCWRCVVLTASYWCVLVAKENKVTPPACAVLTCRGTERTLYVTGKVSKPFRAAAPPARSAAAPAISCEQRCEPAVRRTADTG